MNDQNDSESDFDKFRRQVSRNLYAFRNKKRFTQQDLANESGLPRTTISNIESCTSNPKLSTLLRLCSSLEISFEKLLKERFQSVEVIRAGKTPFTVSKGKTLRERLLVDEKEIKSYLLQMRPRSEEKTYIADEGKAIVTGVAGMAIVYIDRSPQFIYRGSRIEFNCDAFFALQNPTRKPAVVVVTRIKP